MKRKRAIKLEDVDKDQIELDRDMALIKDAKKEAGRIIKKGEKIVEHDIESLSEFYTSSNGYEDEEKENAKKIYENAVLEEIEKSLHPENI